MLADRDAFRYVYGGFKYRHKKGNTKKNGDKREKLKVTVFSPSPVDGPGRWYCERVDPLFLLVSVLFMVCLLI